jgi:hypothetical protein
MRATPTKEIAMNSLPHRRAHLKRNPMRSALPHSLAGRRLMSRHHVPRDVADLLAFLAGFPVEEAS